jgi:hypothetical protein
MHCLLSPVSPRNHHCGGLGRPHGILRTALLGTGALQHLPPHSSPSTGPWPGHHVLVSSGPPLLQPCRVTSLVQTHRGFVELSNCGATAENTGPGLGGLPDWGGRPRFWDRISCQPRLGVPGWSVTAPVHCGEARHPGTMDGQRHFDRFHRGCISK